MDKVGAGEMICNARGVWDGTAGKTVKIGISGTSSELFPCTSKRVSSEAEVIFSSKACSSQSTPPTLFAANRYPTPQSPIQTTAHAVFFCSKKRLNMPLF